MKRVLALLCYYFITLHESVLLYEDNFIFWEKRGGSTKSGFDYNCPIGNCLRISQMSTIKQQFNVMGYTNMSIYWSINIFDFNGNDDRAYMLYKCNNQMFQMGKSYQTNGVRLYERIWLPNGCNDGILEIFFSFWSHQRYVAFVYLDDLSIFGDYNESAMLVPRKDIIHQDSMYGWNGWNSNVDMCYTYDNTCNCFDGSCVILAENAEIYETFSVVGYGNIEVHFLVYVEGNFSAYYECNMDSNHYILLSEGITMNGLQIIGVKLPEYCNNLEAINIKLKGGIAFYDSFKIYGVNVSEILSAKPTIVPIPISTTMKLDTQLPTKAPTQLPAIVPSVIPTSIPIDTQSTKYPSTSPSEIPVVLVPIKERIMKSNHFPVIIFSSILIGLCLCIWIILFILFCYRKYKESIKVHEGIIEMKEIDFVNTPRITLNSNATHIVFQSSDTFTSGESSQQEPSIKEIPFENEYSNVIVHGVNTDGNDFDNEYNNDEIIIGPTIEGEL